MDKQSISKPTLEIKNTHGFENTHSMIPHQKSGTNNIDSLKKKLFLDPLAKQEKLAMIRRTGNFNIYKQKPPIYIILPNSRSKKLWDAFILLVILWNLFIVPIDMGWNLECFTKNNGDTFKQLYLVSSILFFFDLVITFFTAILDDKNNYIYSVEKIIQNYIKYAFWIDLISAFPFDRIKSFDTNDCFQPYISPSKVFLMFSFIRVMKMSRLLMAIERDFSRYSMQIRFFKLFGFILFFSHLVGNLFCGNSPTYSSFAFAECNVFPNNSKEYLDCNRELMSTNFPSLYFYSVYLGIILSFGNDKVTMKSWEMMTMMTVTVISTVTNASIYGNVAVMLNNVGFGVSPILRAKLDVMKEYLNFMKIDERFVSQIEEYHINIWLKQRNMMYQDNFLNDMSLALQRILLLEQWNKNFFANSKFLLNVSDPFILDMIPLFKPKIYMSNDTIITEGDNNMEVYFIPNTGLCQVKIGGVFVTKMGEGEYFGEIAVFLRSRRRTATVVCLRDSDFLFLEGKHFEKLLKDFPNDHTLIKKLAINRLLESMKLYPSSLFAKLVPNNNLKDYMFRKCIYLENEEEDKMFNTKKEKNLMDLSMFNHKLDVICESIKVVKQSVEAVNKIVSYT